MSLGLYVDEHVRKAVRDGLRAREVDVLTVQEDGREGTADAEVLDRAAELGRVVFTQDADFLREAVGRQRRGEFFAGVIYAHQQRVSTGQCVKDLELIAMATDADEYANRVEYLPLR